MCVALCHLAENNNFFLVISLFVIFFDIKKNTDYYQLSGSVMFVKSLLLSFFVFFFKLGFAFVGITKNFTGVLLSLQAALPIQSHCLVETLSFLCTTMFYVPGFSDFLPARFLFNPVFNLRLQRLQPLHMRLLNAAPMIQFKTVIMRTNEVISKW